MKRMGEKMVLFQRDLEPVKEVSYLTDMFGDEAVAFIERRKDQPWFLYLAFNADHSPMQAKEQDFATLREARTKATTESAHLYNLASDPGEQNNLAEKEPGKLKQLAAAWDKWNAELVEAKWLPRDAPPNPKR